MQDIVPGQSPDAPDTSKILRGSVDAQLYAAIQAIQAIDNHAHALPATQPDLAAAEPLDNLGTTQFHYPLRLRASNPEHIEAWQALYRYPYHDMTVEHAREALQAKIECMQQKGADYPAWVLDQAGIERMLVNMPELGPGQKSPRFLWVPYADGLLFPFAMGENAIWMMGKKVSPDCEPPASLDEFVDGVVKPQLRSWKAAEAVAIKFGIAYRRPLEVAHVPVAQARSIYAAHLQDRQPSPVEDRALQDYLLRIIAREAGALGLAVHIHTGVGENPYFDIGGSNPLLLESLFNDETLRQTYFVMLHGGWPFERQAGVMLMKPNVYADFSAQPFLRSTHALSAVLQEWLEWYPEKVLFGTDACPDSNPLTHWEERLWLAARTSRLALALALSRMVRAGLLTQSGAVEMAYRVLHGNAEKLYKLEKS